MQISEMHPFAPTRRVIVRLYQQSYHLTNKDLTADAMVEFLFFTYWPEKFLKSGAIDYFEKRQPAILLSRVVVATFRYADYLKESACFLLT